ncbi:Tape measure domain protein [uncultured Eubacteriales bacterium]|uniref:Tape measure domain protein n=1 Tax=uncultured Eubacteriales bacterium TaxID=172733 RepID=A0A212J4M3_9FIRM|nr:Tape measure domain protein [uncultured Eubacteriales bacterium]
MSVATQMDIRDRMSSVLDKITRNTERVNTALRTTDALTQTTGSQVGGFGHTATEADRAAERVENFNQKQRQAQTESRGITDEWGRIKGAVQGAIAAMGLKKALDLSDTMATTQARLDLMNDGLQTTKELQDQIMASANRSRAAYQTTADAVSKMGIMAADAFGSNKELIAFSELINKQFTIAGTSAAGIDAAMLQLTQAMASGVLRGEELNSVFEQAPTIIQTIAKYLDVPIGKIREMAADGEITASVVKNAMLASADEINAKFESMPMTWGQVWIRMSNAALVALQPVLTGINWLANNIEIIGPLVLGLGAAFLVFQVAAHWTQIAAAATAAYHAVVGFLSIGFGVLTGSTTAATAAVSTFNSALLASPITWIVMLVVILIAALYAVVAIVNKVTGSTVSATGIIAGAVMWLVALIGNIAIGLFNGLIQSAWSTFVEPFIGIIEWVLNVVNGGFDDFGGAVANLIGNIISWFLSLGKVVTKIIDAIFGTDWTGGLTALQDNVLGWGKNETAITLDRSAPEIAHRFDMTDAFDMGYNFGSGIEDKVAGLFGFDGSNMDAIYDGVGDTADNTGKMAESVNIADEDLKFLRDVAEMRFVQNFVTLTPTVAMNASISEKVDVGDVVGEIERRLEEEFAANAEGVYA